MLFNKQNISSYRVGLKAELIARWYLRIHGFRILQTRYVTGKNTNRAEIDIIAKKKDLIIFVEVKSRSDILKAWDAIMDSQIKRLRLAAENYLSVKRWHGCARYDVIFVHGYKVTWMQGVI